MQPAAEVHQVLREYVVTQLLKGKAQGLDESTPLLEWGVLDSLSIVALVRFLEERFGVQVAEDQVSPENFVNLAAISALVTRLGAAPAPRG